MLKSRFVRLILILMLSLGINIFHTLRNSATAALAPGTHNTPQLIFHQTTTDGKESLEPETFASDDIKIAAVSWLPDYLGGFSGNNSADTGVGGKDSLKDCAKYGFQSTVPDSSLYDFTAKKNVAVKTDGTPLTCYTDVKCKSKFQYTSANCTGSSIPSGLSCSGRYESCTCKSEFKYNASNCSGEYQLSGTICGGYYNNCNAKPCSAGGYSDARNNDVCSTVVYGGRTCYSCRAYTCSEKCSGYSAGISCQKGQTRETCSGCSDYARCTGSPCPGGAGSCSYGCKTYSSQSSCSDVCIECKPNPCQGYYSCGGTWQYCTGSKCSADSSMCSNYCASDYFPNACSDSSACQGIYRNGYCSGSCEVGCTPAVGKILFSDMSCSFNVIFGRTPIAIIIDADKRLAIGLNASARTAWSSTNNNPGGNYGISCVTGYDSFRPVMQDGKSLSAEIMSAKRSDGVSYYPVEYCNNYSTAGTSRGDWFLPSLSDWFYAVHRQIVSDITPIENAINKLSVENFLGKMKWTSSFSRDITHTCRMEGRGNYYWMKDDANGGAAVCGYRF